MGESRAEDERIRKAAVTTDKTPNAGWRYRQTEVTPEGVIFHDDNVKGYKHWWYNRYIEVTQRINHQQRTWARPVLSIRGIDLSKENIKQYYDCTAEVQRTIEILECRTGKSINDYPTMFSMKREELHLFGRT